MSEREVKAVSEIIDKANELMSDWPSARQKQKKFILAYVANGFTKRKEAAKEAGYLTSPQQQADNMLNGMRKYEHIPPIIEELRKAFDERLEELSIMTGTELLQFWSQGVRGELTDTVLRGIGMGEQMVDEVPMDMKTRLAFSNSLARALGVDKQTIDLNANITNSPKFDDIVSQLGGDGLDE
ncbi:terminase small subunit [Streptococcus suis]|uniref:terminase small subunit n=1 Tax=Streptococcus suis TaxID=1307 RepID=UPI0028763B40|nr:terminase small subunit [Streptococcus suis]MDS1161626.1 terminase small subunit [Streptococcus suis]